MEGRMEGRRCRGTPRMGMLDELKKGSYEEMKRRQRIDKCGGLG